MLTNLLIISCIGQKKNDTITTKPYISINGKDTIVNNLSIDYIKRANAEHIMLNAALVDIDSCEASRQAAKKALLLSDSNKVATEIQLQNVTIERDNNFKNFKREKNKVNDLDKKNTRLSKTWKSLTGVFTAIGAFLFGIGYYVGNK